jgi:hypothetical protein
LLASTGLADLQLSRDRRLTCETLVGAGGFEPPTPCL